MFRLFRPLHRLAPPWRLAARVTSGQMVQIERVKLTKRRRATRFFGTVIGGAVLIQLLFFTPTSIIPADGDGNGNGNGNGNGDGDGETEEDDGDWFIPFPLTTKKVPGEPYSGNGPEWQEFIRIARNDKVQRWIKRHVAHLVYHSFLANRLVVSRYGEVTSVADIWLDLDYPYVAPPEYERSGILVTDDEVGWATVTCDSTTAKRLHQLLWPRPLALGFWALGTEVVKQTTADCARYLGLASERPSNIRGGSSAAAPATSLESQLSDVQKALERIRQQATRRPEKVNEPSSMASSAAAATPAASTATSTTPDKALRVPGKPPTEPGNQDAPVQPVKQMIAPLPKPVQKAIRAYWDAWKPVTPDPPRGCLLVSGLVKLETPKGWATVMVFAWFNPKTKSIDPASARMAIKKWESKVRRPLPR